MCVNAIFPIVHLSTCTQTVSLLVEDLVFEIPNFAKRNQVILLLIWNQHNTVKKANLVIVGHPGQRIGSGSCQAVSKTRDANCRGQLTIYTQETKI